MAERSDWLNDAEVTLLNGDPIPDTMDFPVDPPAEIGPVRSAYSTCVVGKPLRSNAKRWIGIGLSFLIPAAGMCIAILMSGGKDAKLVGGVIGVFTGLVIASLVLYFTRGNNRTAFVGELGMAQYTFGSSRDIIKRTELFEFQNAIDLFTHSAKQFINGIYTGTTYNFEWKNAEGQRVYRLAGTYSSQKGNPKAKDPYHFANAAEVTWTMFLKDAINIELKEQGAVHFKVNKKDWVKVGPGFLEFHFKNKTARLDVQDIKDLRVGNGQFAIKSRDAGWLGGKGKYGFAYGKMANARLFLMCLEQLCGYSFE